MGLTDLFADLYAALPFTVAEVHAEAPSGNEEDDATKGEEDKEAMGKGKGGDKLRAELGEDGDGDGEGGEGEEDGGGEEGEGGSEGGEEGGDDAEEEEEEEEEEDEPVDPKPKLEAGRFGCCFSCVDLLWAWGRKGIGVGGEGVDVKGLVLNGSAAHWPGAWRWGVGS